MSVFLLVHSKDGHVLIAPPWESLIQAVNAFILASLISLQSVQDKQVENVQEIKFLRLRLVCIHSTCREFAGKLPTIAQS